ncbi:hypothetical protein STEG23_002326 [Scotinomys teguina]
MCRQPGLSGLYSGELNFLRRKQLYCAETSIKAADGDFAIETLKGNIDKLSGKAISFDGFGFLTNACTALLGSERKRKESVGGDR